jgi:hypothetical protein
MGHWRVKKHFLAAPDLHDLATVLDAGLKTHFQDVTAVVAPCPDLRAPPFHLASRGLSGNQRIADVGGPPNLHPTPKFDRKYSLLDLMSLMEMPPARGFVLGAGAGPFHVLGVNTELMPNLGYEAGELVNLTHFAKVDEATGKCVCDKIPSNSTDCALMANLFGSDGSPGDVIKIVAKRRIGEANFLAAIQQTLRARYGDRQVSMGGVFLIKRGKASMHVMPDFSKTPLDMKDSHKWLRFYEMEAPMVCLTVFHSYDPGLALRMEHTHCFSDHGEGGHYHHDTTPDDVEYEAYLNTASVLYRIDQPEVGN